jgi:2-polyprenyl-3-methyl-5-hydroxy-6-metoxy-1,4-benzoquinol methylase
VSELARQPLLSEISRRRKLELFLRHIPPAASVLEVGSGSGWFAAQTRAHGHRVATLDLFGPADFIGDILHWREVGIPPAAFDAVVALEVIEHVDCLAELCALCKPNGVIFLSSPHPSWDWCMKVLERLSLTQTRTSPHSNLTDFATIPLPAVVRRRPMWIHQVAVFRNA